MFCGQDGRTAMVVFRSLGASLAQVKRSIVGPLLDTVEASTLSDILDICSPMVDFSFGNPAK